MNISIILITILCVAFSVGFLWLFLYYLPKKSLETERNKSEEERKKEIKNAVRRKWLLFSFLLFSFAFLSFFGSNESNTWSNYIWGIVLTIVGIIFFVLYATPRFDPVVNRLVTRLSELMVAVLSVIFSTIKIGFSLVIFILAIWGILILFGFNFHSTSEGIVNYGFPGGIGDCKEIVHLQPYDWQTYFGTFVGSGGYYIRVATENGICTKAYVYTINEDPSSTASP